MLAQGEMKENTRAGEELARETDQAEYEELWKIFHEAIAIEERRNPVCQRNLLPLRFRPYMTEFIVNLHAPGRGCATAR